MQKDKDLDALESNTEDSHGEAPQEENLEWLLDMEQGDSEETLFKVDDEKFEDQGLSALEAEMAARPMTGSSDKGDDLTNYVAEEIVISSDGASSDIYADSNASSGDTGEAEEAAHKMAIDFTRGQQPESQASSNVKEGTDILGLASEDDIGETYLTIKRVKAPATESSQNVVARAESPEVEQELTSGVAVGAGAVSAAAGSDVIGGESGLDDTGLSLDALEYAPVPSQIAQEQNPEVANETDSVLTDDTLDENIEISLEEEGEFTDDTVAAAKDEVILFETADGLPETEEPGQVDDFLSTLPELDDDKFDEYLLQGEHLDVEDADVDSLSVEDSEDVLSVDVSGDVDIDYHEDFNQIGGLQLDVASDITAVIPQVMEEISSAAEARLIQFGLNVEALRVDAQLGADEESVQRCEAEGFAPVAEVYPEVPRALARFSDEERAVVYVRLQHSDCETDNFNELFGAAFQPHTSEGAIEAVPAETLADLDSDFDVDTDFDFGSAELEEAAGNTAFDADGEDIFGADFADDLDDVLGDEKGVASDIDAVFSSLSGGADDEDDAFFGVELDEAAVEDAETLEAGSPEPEIQEEGVAAELPAAEPTEEVIAEMSAEEPVEKPAVRTKGKTAKSAGKTAAKTAAAKKPAKKAAKTPAKKGGIKLASLDSSKPNWFVPKGVKFNESAQTGGDIFTDFLDAFVEEGSAEIEKLEELITEWEKDVSSEEISAEVGRTLHTVKGIAKGVGLQRYGTLIHNFETLLEALPEPAPKDEQIFFRLVNVWLDAVVRGIEFVGDKREDVASELPVARGEEDKKADEAKAAAAKAAARPLNPAEKAAASAEEDKQLADEGAKALAVQQTVRITSEKLDHLLNLASQTQQLSVRSSQSNNRGKRSLGELQGRLSSVRTHIGKIADRALLSVKARGNSTLEMDALEMDQYSELQEAASILREGVEDLADLIELLGRHNHQVELLLKQQSSVISSITSSIQSARVVPVSRLMPGLRRIVRTVSTDLGKVVSFRVLNEVGALDRDHYARLQVVLEHMVRNALDHGIESPDERTAAGKSNAGNISVDVVKSGGDYVITLADDGRGIDPDAIRRSAKSKGLDIDVDALSDEEAQRLVFHKGFSTAEKVSEISGRGVGMDIVISELRQLGGDIQISSRPGEGTTFEVRVPSNVTVNGALMVTAADDSYAIPLNGLIAVEQVPAEEFFRAVQNGGKLNLFDLACEPAYLATLCQGVALPERNFWEAFVPVIIAGSGERHMAIAIDNVEEALELVVRSLGSQFSNVPGLAGAATTADGEAIVALDLNLLVDSVRDDGIAPIADSREESQSLLALVVDDSRTQRMVATSQLETVGVETITAENGLVAIDLLNATHRLPDVVLLDVEMPVKDGIETLREIRKSQRYGDLPVIMVTSRTGGKHRSMAKEAGCNAYMGKPFNFPALVEQINVLTGHNLQLS